MMRHAWGGAKVRKARPKYRLPRFVLTLTHKTPWIAPDSLVRAHARGTRASLFKSPTKKGE